ncbi:MULTISPECIES: hypothetical protein [unclassified Vibrio]|uniref:hypothetical protein n=1 Tax=unclassified Vibrio TaxID=2614977 RepID=UPI00354B117C
MQTLKRWNEICRFVSLNRLDGSLDSKSKIANSSTKRVFFKHDVEANPERALDIARIEAEHGIQSVFYFQFDVFVESISIASQIQNLGHEIGYHYDVLDANNGCFELAILDFQKSINKFHEYGFAIETVCPHGNPVLVRDGWNSNKDFFRNKNVRDLFPGIFDIVVDARKVFGETFTYYTDAGYSWKKVTSIDENDREQIPDIDIIDLIKDIESSNSEIIILSNHPHRWMRSPIRAFSKKYLFVTVRYLARILTKITFINTLMSKFYFIARRF